MTVIPVCARHHVGEGVRLAAVEQRHRLPTFQGHHDRAVTLALPVGPVIDPNGQRAAGPLLGQTPHQSQQGVPTGGKSSPMCEPCASLPAEGHADHP